MNLTKTLLVAAALSISGWAGHAATVTIQITGEDYQADCTGTAVQPCFGLIGGSWDVTGDPASESATNADLYPISPSSEGAEAQALDLLIDGLDDDDFVAADANKTDTFGVDSFDFFSVAEYIMFKVGNDYFILHLFAPAPIHVEYDKIGDCTDEPCGQGGGLSHYTEFGETTVIPLPAAGWLLIAGLGGLVALRHRRKS